MGYRSLGESIGLKSSISEEIDIIWDGVSGLLEMEHGGDGC